MFDLLSLHMGFDLVEMHHIRILVMQVKKINLVGKQMSIEAALFNHRHVEPVRIAVDRARAHAAAGRLAAYDKAINTEAGQVGDQGRAKETAGPFLVDDQIAGLGFKFLLNLKVLAA